MGWDAERWLPVHGWEGVYEVSDMGRVQSLTRIIAYRNGRKHRIQGRVLRQELVTQYGYRRVPLRRPGESFRPFVHRLVLEAFWMACPEGTECDHINADTSDNRLSNLRWLTPTQNAAHRVALGRQVHLKGESHGQSKLTDGDIVSVRARYAAGDLQRVIAYDFCIDKSVVSRIVTGKAWAHVQGGAS